MPVQRYHDRVAARYDHMYDDAFWAWHDTLTWDHLKGFLPTMQRAEVIDLGCGTGKWGLKLLHAGYRVTFVDISGAMVEQARRKVTEIHREDRATFLAADLCDLHTVEAERYELAIAMGDPIGCSNSPPLAVKQIARLLRPGGVLVATFDNILAGLEHYLDQGRLDDLEEYLHTGKTRWLTRDKPEQFEIHTFSPLGARKLLAGAGLEVLDIVGKTVLPMRACRHLLEDPTVRRRLLKLEKQWWRDESAIGRCSHLQIAARKLLLSA
jgi:SAM-dependent methyltransferase